MAKTKKEIIFELRKIINKKGCVVRQDIDLKSPKIVELPHNSIVAINNPPKIAISASKHLIEIIQPIKGWIFEDDLLDLDTIEYLKHGSKYEKYLNNLIEAIGESEFLKETDILVNKENKPEFKVVIIPEKQEDNSIDLKEIKAYRNFDQIKYNITSKIYDLDLKVFNEELISSNYPCLLYFGASWCGPCHKVKPLLEELINKLEGINLYICDVDINPELSEKLKVTTIPMLFYYFQGEIKNSQNINYNKIDELEKEIIKFRDNYLIKSPKKSHKNKSPKKKSLIATKGKDKKLSQKK